MCPSSPGQLVDAKGPQTKARVTRYSWSTPRDLVHQLEASHPGQLVDPTGGRTGDRVTGRGQPRGPSDPILSRAGPHVEPVGPWIRARVVRDPWSSLRSTDPGWRHPGYLVNQVGPRAGARDARDDWSTMRDHQPGPGWPGKPGRPLGHSVPWRESPGTAGQHCGPSEQSAILPGQCQHREPTDTSASHTGHQVDTAGPGQGPETPSVSWSIPASLRGVQVARDI